MTGLLGYVMPPQSTPTLLHKSPIVCNQMSLAVCKYIDKAQKQLQPLFPFGNDMVQIKGFIT